MSEDGKKKGEPASQGTSTVNDEEKQPEERAKWGKSIEFLLSCIAMNVGLGNIWRFPFVAYENGGGAFLIPYLIVLMVLGRPMYYLEMCLGQFSSRGNVKMFEAIAPILKGVGFGQLIGTFSVATYYCTLMAITLFYLVNSFTSHLPWGECNPAWNATMWMANATCIPSQNAEHPPAVNGTSISSAEAWFRIEVLKEKIDITDGIGYPDWQLTVCLFVSWCITFAICAKGVHSSGKASYFLAIFPFIILFALLVRAVTLEGAPEGFLYFITPDWSKLTSASVWYAAVTQCFFSLNIGFGSVTMYASYNDFRHNVYRDAMVVTILDTFTSLLAGLIIFGILGNLAHKMEVEVSEVIKSGGTGLAFISYPEAIALFDDVPWLFAILFFAMLFILGVGSLIALKGCAFTVIMDNYPHLKIWHVSLVTAIIGFLIGLVYVTPGGQWIFQMVDFFGGTFIFFVLTIIEIVSISWWYGLDNICLDIEFMINRKPGIYWRICWAVIVPIILIVVFFYFVFTFDDLEYENKPYPNDVIVWGWLLFAFGVLQPVFWWCFDLIRKSRKERVGIVIANSFKHDAWSPNDSKLAEEWRSFKQEKKMERINRNRNWIIDKLCVLVGK